MKKQLLALIAAASLFAFIPFSGQSAEEQAGETVKLYLGENKSLSVRSPSRVAIGNPEVADVAEVSRDNLVLIPKARGRTMLTVQDAFGEQFYIVEVYSDDTQALKEKIDDILRKLGYPGISAQAQDDAGKVFLFGSVKSKAQKDKIFLALGQLKDKTVDLINIKEDETIIEIDVQLLEMNKGATDTLGFTWPGSLNLLEVGSPGISSGGASQWGNLFKVGKLERATAAGAADPYTLKLDVLIQEGKARVLSRPRLACQSGKEAKLVVGGEKPILTSSYVGGGTSGTTATPGNVDYKEYGIILNIKPTVDEDNRIRLSLKMEVSEAEAAVSTSYALAYPLTKRTAATELILDDGQLMAIGGLIKQKTTESIRKVPWLGDLPLVGALFRQKTTTTGSGYDTKSDTELFITLRPTIVSGNKPREKKPQEKPAPGAEPPAKAPEAARAAAQDQDIGAMEYAGIVQNRILRNISYPRVARDTGYQGTVKLRLRISYTGELLECGIKDSSGFKILDDTALSAAANIPSYPPFPPTVQNTDLWVEVPIIYKLN